MYKKQIIRSLLIIVTALISLNTTAQVNWLDKAGTLLKQQGAAGNTTQPGLTELTDAFRLALRNGSDAVVTNLGRPDGFNLDPAIHIPLPSQLNKVKTLLDKVGKAAIVSDLELKLNRAAEAATPKARQLFMQSIADMTFSDIKTIYNGPADSATRYFQGKMTSALGVEMRPIVEASLSEVGAVQAYDKLIGSYKALPFVPDIKADLTNHVVSKSLEGIFYYLAKEEAAIRSDPAKQTTALLKKVFGVTGK